MSCLPVMEAEREPPAACRKCKLPLRCLEAPWPWYCSMCSAGYAKSDPIYGCAKQEQCQSIDDWGVCRACVQAADSAEIAMEKVPQKPAENQGQESKDLKQRKRRRSTAYPGPRLMEKQGRNERKQQEQAQAATILYECTVRWLSDSCLDRKACSWAVSRWLPIKYVPCKSMDAYLFRALAVAMNEGAVSSSVLDALHCLRTKLDRTSSAASVVEALDNLCRKVSPRTICRTALEARPEAPKRCHAESSEDASTKLDASSVRPPHRLRKKTRESMSWAKLPRQISVPKAPKDSESSRRRRNSWLPRKLAELSQQKASQTMHQASIRRRRNSWLPRKVAELSRSKATELGIPQVSIRRRRNSWLPRKVAELAELQQCERSMC